MKVLYFGAAWCGQCKIWKPKYEAKCKELGIELTYYDADENEQTCEAFGVRNVPYVVLVGSNDEIQGRGMAIDMYNKLTK